jgi:hypothetical protein
MTDLLEKVERALTQIIGECDASVYAGGEAWVSPDNLCELRHALAALSAYRASLADADVVEVAERWCEECSLDLPKSFARIFVNIITPILRSKLEQEMRREMLVDTSRSGKALRSIVGLLPRQSTWTASDLIRALEVEGVEVTHKEIYNAISYAARKGYVSRTGYGRYIVNSTALATKQDGEARDG